MNRDVCQDIIAYSRERVIGNEIQMLMTTLAATTMYSSDPSEYVGMIIVGETSGGKTHLQRNVMSLFPEENIYKVTSSSDKGPIYSNELRYDENIKFIQFAEYQKLPKPVLEFIKSLSGDDDTFSYTVTINGGNSETITHRKYAYNITYAQVELDPELKSRVLVMPVVENYDINRCVSALKLGVKSIEYNGVQYDTEGDAELCSRLKSTIASMNGINMKSTIAFPMALVDMVNHSKSESKRHAGLIASLIKASAKLNWSNRTIDVDGNVIASAQDVANILCMFELLRATTMGADLIDMTLYEKLVKTPRLSEEELIRYLQNQGLAELTKTEIGRRLNKLYDENYIVRDNTTTGFLYSSNTYKESMQLSVDWDMIYEEDNSSIINVLNGDEYKNIIEFGKCIESLYNPEDESKRDNSVETLRFDGVEKSENQISYDEVISREAILTYLKEDKSEATSKDILVGVQYMDDKYAAYIKKGHDYFEMTQLISQMVDEDILEYNDKTNIYKINSLME